MTFYDKLNSLTKIKENQIKCYERHFENFVTITLSRKIRINKKR